MNRILATIVAIAIATGAAPVSADKGHAKHQDGAAGMVDGEIRKVDKDAKKLTIKHGPMPSLDMPAMTMVFQVKDPAMLDKVKAGDKVKFQAEKLSGAFTVTGIEPAK
jgi:Cu(I)/Ag(I) efflux system protein CusF